MLDLPALFEKYDDEYGKFENIPPERRKHPNVFINALVILQEIDPSDCDPVSAAEHDEIWLNPDEETLAEKATEEQIVDLIRCRAFFEEGVGLSMFA